MQMDHAAGSVLDTGPHVLHVQFYFLTAVVHRGIAAAGRAVGADRPNNIAAFLAADDSTTKVIRNTKDS